MKIKRLVCLLLAMVLAASLLGLPTAFAVEGDTASDSGTENSEPVAAEETDSDSESDTVAGEANEESLSGEGEEPQKESSGSEEEEEPVSDTPQVVSEEEEIPAAEENLEGEEEGSETEEAPVAQIGDVSYPTLDEAVAAAESGDTITLLGNAETAGLNLSKRLTIQAADGIDTPTITFTTYGIALWGVDLTFKNVNVVMTGIGSTPYTAEWNWMAICASVNANLTLDNVTMTMDGTGAGNAHAIYFCKNNKLNLINGSVLTIQNYQQDALEWDGGDGGYNINIIDSTFISDSNRSGFTGTLYVTITNSTVKVINSTGNGSNGSHFIITNSDVNFSNNGSHGLSAGILTVTNSTITAENNGITGVIFNNTATFVNSTVTITGTKGTSYWSAGMRLLSSNSSATIDKDCVITITDNAVTGLFLDSNTSLTIEEGAQVLITRNCAYQENYSTYKELAQSGGGIVVRTGATAVLSASTVLYNNHAGVQGDDIYLEGDGSTITFGAVGSDWYLDGDPDCEDQIDGWYYDGQAGVRWDAHGSYYTVLYSVDSMATATGRTALKAAHGIPQAAVPGIESPDWTVSNSKTATELDENYESQVTLSLPSAEEQLVTDVVFVLDKSTSAELEEQALAMLQELQEQLEDTNAKINVAVVIFNKVANVTGFMDLATEYDAIEYSRSRVVPHRGQIGNSVTP